MKKRSISYLLAVILLVNVLMPAALAANHREVIVQEMHGAEYFRLDDLKTYSDISVEQSEHEAVLEEDGLRVRLLEDSPYVYRDHDIVGSMKQKPVVKDGVWYAPMDFYDGFLGGQDEAVPSLFHGTLFYKQEVLGALSGSGSAAFRQKLLEAVSLPVSMQIKVPHVDMSRVFVDSPLSSYSENFSKEMARLGFQNPGQMKYSEYVVVNGAQTLSDAGMASALERYPELKGKDPHTMTVAEYNAWEQAHLRQQYEDGLSEEVKTFAKENDIRLSDLSHLNRYFNGGYMEKSKDALKQVLTEYYETDLAYLQGSGQTDQTFKDVKQDDWFFENVMFAVAKGLMNGTSDTTFSPAQVISRGQIVTILWRLEGEPVVKDQMQFADVSEGQWYSEAIRWAASEKIADGYGSTFGTNDPITREQFAAILWRYAKHKGIKVETNQDTELNFEDAQRISAYAVEAMRWACGAELMKGNAGRLLPANTATRAEAAAMMQRFYPLISKSK